jgi:hypothetical protein
MQKEKPSFQVIPNWSLIQTGMNLKCQGDMQNAGPSGGSLIASTASSRDDPLTTLGSATVSSAGNKSAMQCRPSFEML